MSDWMAGNDTRENIVLSSLKSRSRDLRNAAAQCRKAYTKAYMSVPMNWLADAYDEAADILDSKVAVVVASRSSRASSGERQDG